MIVNMVTADERQVKSKGISFTFDELIAESLIVRMKVFKNLGYDINDQTKVVLKVKGNHMLSENVRKNDLVVINKKLKPKNGDVVIARHKGILIIRKYVTNGKRSYLISKNDAIPEKEFNVWGVVTHAINIIDGQSNTKKYVNR